MCHFGKKPSLARWIQKDISRTEPGEGLHFSFEVGLSKSGRRRPRMAITAATTNATTQYAAWGNAP